LGLKLLLVQAFEQPWYSEWSVQSWSISAEVWLYLLAAWGWRWLGRGNYLLAGGLALAAAAAMMLLPYEALVTPFSFEMLRGVLGFGCGMVTWRCWRAVSGAGRASDRRGPWFAGVCEAAVLALAVACICMPAFNRGTVLLPDLAFALVVLVFAADAGWCSRLLARGPFVRLGLLSYSIYMVHGVIVGRMIDLLGRFGMARIDIDTGTPVRVIVASPAMTDLLTVIIVAVVVAVS